MLVDVELTDRGFALSINGQAYNAPPCEFRFPEEVWEKFPAKQALANELAYLTTLATPLILKHPRIHFSTAKPHFLSDYQQCFEKSIPNLVEWIPSESSAEILEDFRSIDLAFADSDSDPMISKISGWNNRRVVLPLSFGKDSLLSLSTLLASGYEVIPVNIDERIQPRWNRIRNRLIERLQKEQDLTCLRVDNELQLLSDYQVLQRPESRLYQMQVHFGYLFAMLPFCFYYQAPTIILSNEYPNALDKVHREGYLSVHKIMQGREGMKALARVAKSFSNDQVSVANPIGGLGNFAIHRVLHKEFPEFASLQVSCHLEMSEYDRWCHNCERCAQAYLFFLALGEDPKEMDFKESMLTESKKEHFRVFGPSIHKKDHFRRQIYAEESLAFLMAHEKGCKEPLIELFISHGVDTSPAAIKKLAKKVFKVQLRGKHKIEKVIAALFKETFELYRR